ncbi:MULTISPECIES: winged helix-turn-helix transcriptional regulator [Pseudomonas]|nr:helix-turn-helix domain-containing protein [Pseudomonas moraviensis]
MPVRILTLIFLARETVRALKDERLSQAEIARKLGMAKTTVHRHWHRSS